MKTDLTEKIALVTGASSGLGAQFARVLAANGALVVLAARRVERLKELRAEIESQGGAADVVPLDVGDLESIEAAVAKIEAENGPIDILVNNAGVSTVGRLTDVTPLDYDFMFDTNVKGAFFMAQAVARRMINRAKRQQDFRGRIVNIASVAAFKVVSQIGVYCMTKAALVHMTRAQANEWGRYGINVNAICPGYIRTEINESHWDTEAGQKLVQMLPRRRVGEASDLDSALLMLVADESQFINGAVIAADDGLSVT
ncbi:MAG: SDR family oxidoreductase [Burkholderiales bacterium]|jgi:NAD(P)-dependent dehydrogenase (short-subunit alcohol dehydrogenase family)|nr:SDR family oxidoreductase [Burkholderiales bacterium]MCA3226376.1 SDR family oxidoreductase [Burkholderiales bacterium]MCE2646431.1 SDR family oxidoreductase [Burkholderiaceae bacterium]